MVTVVVALIGSGVAVVALGAGTLRLRATGFSAFSTKSLNTSAGRVTLSMTNQNTSRHNIALKGRGIKTVRGTVVGKGKVSSVTVTLKAGKYTFFCSEPGHELAGMKGTLTIR
jgi:uncharacterized cupredoxin-like copper-binding protein